MTDMSTIYVLPALAQALQPRVAVFELPSGLVAVDLTRSVVPSRAGQSLLTLPLHKEKRVSPDCHKFRERKSFD